MTATYATAAHNTGSDPASPGTDYSTAPGTLRIPAGNTSTTISVATLTDSEAEHDETFLVKIDNPANATIADSTGQGTIIDTDGQPRLSVADLTVVEDEGPAQFTVSLSHASTDDVTVGYRTVACSGHGCAASGTDYTFTSGTLTITAGDNSGTVDVPIIDDIAEEGDETFTLQLVSPTKATILDNEATATIIDDESNPRITVADVTVDEDVTGGTLDFTVTLSHAADTDVTVNYATFDRTATQPYDYTATAGTLTIPKDDTTATISVTINNDNLTEGETMMVRVCRGGDPSYCEQNPDLWMERPGNVGSETFLLRLDSPTGATLDDAEATGEITDDEDLPQVGVVETAANEDEGHIVFTPTLSHPSIHTVTARYDYETIYNSCVRLGFPSCVDPPFDTSPGDVSFPPGTTSVSLPIAIYDNNYTSINSAYSFRYSNATFRFKLTSPVVNGRGSSSALAIIWDDETAPYMESLDGVDVAEDAGNAVFTMKLNRISDEDVTVAYRTTTTGTATAGSDYTAVDSTVTFPAGTRTMTVSVPIIDDSTDESSETIVLEIYSSSSNSNFAFVSVGDDRTGTVSIIDDDETPELSISDAQASESSGSMTFLVALDRASDQDITVDYATSDGTGSDAATAGSDYTAASGTLTFTAGDVSASFTVTLEDDGVSETREQFTVTLSNNSSGAIISDATATGWIYDGNSLPTLIVYDSSRTERYSTYSRHMYFTFNYSEDIVVPWTVEFRMVEVPSLGDEAATLDVDIKSTPSLASSAGDGWYRFGRSCSQDHPCRKTEFGWADTHFNFEILPDTVPEQDEKFRVELRNPVSIGLATTQVWGTIVDDDLPIVTIDDVTVSEGASSAVITLDLHDEGVDAASVKYRTKVLTTGHTASPGDDYTQTEGTLDIPAGTNSATITVPLLGDTTDEYDERFVLELYQPDKLVVNDTIAVVTITDDDDGWHITDDTEAEGTALSFTVTRDNTTSALTLNYTVQEAANSSATGGTHCTTGVDYITPSGTLTFAAGTATATLTINTCNDTVTEGAEIFLIKLASTTPTQSGTFQGRKLTGTATISASD